MATSASRSSSRPRPRSTGSSHSITHPQEGTYVPPQAYTDQDFDFCNSFWVTPQRSRRDARDEDSEERDWGKEGYETVLGRVKAASKVLDDLRTVFKERASIEEEYAKRLTKLSKHQFGTGETGHMERAMLTLKGELEQSAKSHHDLATLLRQQDAQVADFVAKRDGARKTQQSAIEKTWKSLLNQREHVLKAKSKYENDAIQINSLHAQASLLQGRELDKATLKMDKVQQTVIVNERDYRNFVGVLKETTVSWNMAWKTFCDLVQDQEEERLEFIKGRMWDWANAQSTIAMAEDESAERTRTALEQCDPKLDIRIFVQRFATGNSIPDPLPFVDATRATPHPKQSYKTAKFSRSSTRIPGVRHSPSAVTEIARALHQNPAPAQPLPQTAATGPGAASARAAPTAGPAAALPQRGAPGTQASSQSGPIRPPSRGAQHPSNAALYAESASPTKDALSPSQETTPTRPLDTSASSRFAVSPGANLRHPPAGPDGHRAASPTPGSRPGHIPASAFQNRASPVVPSGSTVAPPAQYAPSPATSLSKPSTGAAAPNATNDDENDPLLQALKVLQSTPAPAASPRSNRMSPHPSSSSSIGTGQAPSGRPLSSIGQPPSSVDLRGPSVPPSASAPTHRPTSSLGQAPTGLYGAGARSLPTSPAPVAAMMQPPGAPVSGAQPPTSASVPYGQAFPGERRASQAISRPASRAGSAVGPSGQAPQQQQQQHRASVSGAMLTSPSSIGNFHARPTSPGPGGPVGARGRSPSPQPYIPDSLRPRSPAVAQQIATRAASPAAHQAQQARPTSAYGHRPQQQQQQQQPTQGYGRPPSAAGQYAGPQQGYPTGAPQQHPYASAPSPAANQPQHSPYAAPASSAGPYARTASPAPGPSSTVGGYAPPAPLGTAQAPPQHPYSIPAASSQHFAPPPQTQGAPPSQQRASPYANVPPTQQYPPAASPAGSYPYGQAPSHSHSPYAPPPAQHAPPAPNQQYQYTSPPPPSGSVVSLSQPVQRTPSMHSGVSQSPSVHLEQQQQQQQQTYPASYGGAPPQQQQPQQQQQQPAHARASSVASVRAGSQPPPPPTGQYTDQGQPIIFYVNALFDYRAASNEEFSFSSGDVIAVTATDPDGWWQGQRVGDAGPSKLFPSKSVF
ncbi:hypothetical protein JCM10212_003910 [Sporobolomyces blumeae]